MHILVPQAARPDQQHRSGDLHTKLRKLKQYIKHSMQEQAAASAAATAAAATAAAAVQRHISQGGQDPLGSPARVWAPAGHPSADRAAAGGISAAAVAAVSASGQPEPADGPIRPHQLRPNSLSGPTGWASLRRHSHAGQHMQADLQQAEQQQQQSELVASLSMGLPAIDAAAAAGQEDPLQLVVVAGGLQHNLQEVCGWYKAEDRGRCCVCF